MSYFSNTEEQSLSGWLGCGPECSCGPCRSGMHGFGERYEREEEDEPPATPPPKPQAGSLNGWHGYLSYFGFDDGETPAPDATPQAAPTPEAPAPAPAPPPSEARAPEAPTPEAPPVRPEASPQAEQQLVQDAVSSGIRNPWQLTDIVFFARHPARKGMPINPNETDLISERRHIRRTLVLPALRQAFMFRRAPARFRARPRPRPRFARFGFAGVPAGPVCGAARADLETVAADLKLFNNELAKGAGASAHRLDLKRRLLDLDVNGMITSLDSYIVSGCCEPSLKTLESEVRALPWHVSVDPMRSRLLREIAAAQARAKKDLKHC